jgi:hypothetical protein
MNFYKDSRSPAACHTVGMGMTPAAVQIYLYYIIICNSEYIGIVIPIANCVYVRDCGNLSRKSQNLRVYDLRIG